MTASDDGLTQEEFIAEARRFLREIGGVNVDAVDADAHLLDMGILDSLALIAYVSFLEELRGTEIDMGPEELTQLMTLRSAYALVRPGRSSREA